MILAARVSFSTSFSKPLVFSRFALYSIFSAFFLTKIQIAEMPVEKRTQETADAFKQYPDENELERNIFDTVRATIPFSQIRLPLHQADGAARM